MVPEGIEWAQFCGYFAACRPCFEALGRCFERVAVDGRFRIPKMVIRSLCPVRALSVSMIPTGVNQGGDRSLRAHAGPRFFSLESGEDNSEALSAIRASHLAAKARGHANR